MLNVRNAWELGRESLHALGSLASLSFSCTTNLSFCDWPKDISLIATIPRKESVEYFYIIPVGLSLLHNFYDLPDDFV
jgi:hypothetical protein